jgi:hypothetical protein
MTDGMPPMSKRSAAMYRPEGARSARKGILLDTRWKSSRVRGTPAVPAMARRCNTALVEPPRTIIMTRAFSKLALVRSLLGVMFFSMQTRMAAAALAHSRILAGDVAGVVEELGSVRPIADTVRMWMNQTSSRAYLRWMWTWYWPCTFLHMLRPQGRHYARP